MSSNKSNHSNTSPNHSPNSNTASPSSTASPNTASQPPSSSTSPSLSSTASPSSSSPTMSSPLPHSPSMGQASSSQPGSSPSSSPSSSQSSNPSTSSLPSSSRSRLSRTQTLVRFSILLAILAIFCFTPLGSLPSIGGVVVMTLGMIPVILAALTMGTRLGSLMGFFAGLFSFIVWTFTPPNPVTAFIFTPFYSSSAFQGNAGSLLICFVPRILVGTVTGLVYQGLARPMHSKKALACGIAGLLGSLTNTVGVLGGTWLFFGNQYASIEGTAILTIIGITVLTNGLPEAALSFVTGAAVGWPLKRVLFKET